jgi:hypothetical protein
MSFCSSPRHRGLLGCGEFWGFYMGYEDAQAGAHMRTAFRNAEKHYKRYTQASSLSKSSR